jgi:hypothetical protein
LQDLALLAGGPESAKLAADLLEHGIFPANARADAHYLAVATCAAVDYLLTWNYRHLARKSEVTSRELVAEKGRQLAEETAFALNDKPKA